ncbi:MAG: di-trans,poly-cis-decaprenylcistransferase [Lentisphaerae bacterium GWF2_45_14]|nr:MAG: di-trans,poly-cis-decaprenylcistransferase [Lentisphaerae bacterium GWF2_45_14]
MAAEKKRELQHVAIIMDGNGRWAKKHGLEHIEGHKKGAEAVKQSVEVAKELGIKYLTLYAFSTENWKRPENEVKGLMSLLRDFLEKHMDEMNEKGISIRAVGRIDKLPFLTRRKLLSAIKKTRNNKEGTLVLALNYGGRAEIVDAAKKIADDVSNGKIKSSDLDEELFKNYLYAPDIPDPELMIRTSGEFRLSNFLLWELSYSEIYISDVLWPDFDKNEFKKAVESYYGRDRRFGGRQSKALH